MRDGYFEYFNILILDPPAETDVVVPFNTACLPRALNVHTVGAFAATVTYWH